MAIINNTVIFHRSPHDVADVDDCGCESSIININNGLFGDMVGESSSGETDISDVSVDSNPVIADVVSVIGRFVNYAAADPYAGGGVIEGYE